jgi:hypothetical protein
MWTDRQTDITKLAVAFRNFANASKNIDPAFLRDAQHKHMSHVVTEKQRHCIFSLPKVVVITRILSFFPYLEISPCSVCCVLSSG